MTQIADARRKVVKAIQQLIKAEMQEDQGSMGTYYEEKILNIAFEDYELVMRKTNIGATEVEPE